jgi:putative lipoic acid-binding regulatory protein
VSDQEPPKIEFPCDYPIKVLGVAGDAFEATITEVFHRHAPGFDPQSVRLKISRKGTFNSFNIIITATGESQLEALHRDLLATGLVKMVI